MKLYGSFKKVSSWYLTPAPGIVLDTDVVVMNAAQVQNARKYKVKLRPQQKTYKRIGIVVAFLNRVMGVFVMWKGGNR